MEWTFSINKDVVLTHLPGSKPLQTQDLLLSGHPEGCAAYKTSFRSELK